MTTERLFFALWPDDSIRATIAQRMPEWAGGLAGRWQRPDQWHVTLVFLGAVDAARRGDLQAAADGVTMPPLELQFDRYEYWHKPQVACLVATVTPAPLAQFVERLRAAVAMLGIEPELRPYRPHVTLARKVRSAAGMVVSPPVNWTATGFALVRSNSDPSGSRYEPVHWWNGGVRGG